MKEQSLIARVMAPYLLRKTPSFSTFFCGKLLIGKIQLIFKCCCQARNLVIHLPNTTVPNNLVYQEESGKSLYYVLAMGTKPL